VGALELWQWSGLALTLGAVLAAAWVVRRFIAQLWRRHGPNSATEGLISEDLLVWTFCGLAAGLVILAAIWALGLVEYSARDVGPDPDRVQEVEAEVEGWRSAETLPFPDFEWQTKAKLSGSLDYPPTGSVARGTNAAP
jgi:hypothetical protein